MIFPPTISTSSRSPSPAARQANGSSTRNTASSLSTKSSAARFPVNSFLPSKRASAKRSTMAFSRASRWWMSPWFSSTAATTMSTRTKWLSKSRAQASLKAMEPAKAVLLEPIMKVEVVVPEEYMPPVFGDLNARRSAIQGTESRAGSNVIRVEVPLAQMFGYATDLRSRTQGRATFTMHFSHYAELPAALAEEVIKKHRGEK